MKLSERIHVKSVLCVLLAAVLITASFSANGLTVAARGEERTFDIGVNPESVTATLSEGGVLTVKGSGAIRDFTPDTAPFADCQIKTLKLGADLTAIGDYTFYNCGGITGTLVLPKGLLRIGDRAFSGSSGTLAPKPASVENGFTESLITKRKTADSSPVSSGPAEGDSADNSPEESEPAKEEPADADPAGEPEDTVSEPAEQEAETAQENKQDDKETGAPGETEGNAEEESSAPKQEQTETKTETKYVIEKIVQQEIGEEIFFLRADGPAFLCSAENQTFRAAMLEAGYREAGTLLSVTFHCGEGSSSEGDALAQGLPVLDGKIVLPEAPAAFSAPEGDGLYRYVFGGWTESQDPSGTLRAAGSVFSAEDRTDLYFTANWKRELIAKIAVQQEGGTKVFTVPALEGYDTLSYRWQTCTLGAGEEKPQDEETLSWEDIPEETAQSYRWEIVPADTNRLFRCVVTVKKQQNFLQALFGGSEEQEAAFAAVEAIPAEAEETVAAQGTAIIRGRSFSGSISGVHPTIGTTGAVTASFVSQYKPTGKDDVRLFLCKKEGEAFAKAVFPAGTKLVLGDLTGGRCKYYSYTAQSGSDGLSLADFTAVSGTGKYAPPAAGDTVITEKLLIVADFSGGALPQGEYGLAIVHGTEQWDDVPKAAFAVVAVEGCGLDLTKQEAEPMTWSVAVSPSVSGIDSRYAAGACIRLWLTDPEGESTFPFPGEMLAVGDKTAENILLEQDGSLTFTMPAGGTAVMTLQFTAVQASVLPNGDYRLHASLSPRAGLQMSSRQGQTDASATVEVSLYRAAEEETKKRDLIVALEDESQRLLDVSEKGQEMRFLLSYQGVQEGDTLQTEVLYKTGTDLDDSSYSPASGNWGLSPASGSGLTGDRETLRLTVPQGQQSGTYCLRVRIVDPAGSVTVEESYDFIVK